MTPEQAAHHPSRNVISRALGAETGVDVDMKTIEVEDGTAFLLCSDGITRHIPDNEIRELLTSGLAAEDICSEMKRRCYERGAEDNLTAVIVFVGNRASAAASLANERTLDSTRSALALTVDSAGNLPVPMATVPSVIPAATAPPPPSVIPPPPANPAEPLKSNPILAFDAQGKSRARKSGGRGILLFLLLIGIGAGAFYGGTYFQRWQAEKAAQPTAIATPTPAPTPTDTVAEFEKRRHQVDKAPAVTGKTMRDGLAAKGEDPLASDDPEFLYLYGRALLLMGDNQNALLVFVRAIDVLKANASPPENRLTLYDKLKVESRLGALAAVQRLRSKTLNPDPNAEQKAIHAFDEWINQSINPITSSQ